MALATFGVERTEEELRESCDCGLEGAQAIKLVDVARQLGLQNTRKYNLSFEELVEQLALGKYPIVYVRTRLGSSRHPTQHAFVVLEANRQSVTVLDPWQGERRIATAEFEHCWGQMRGLTILCEK
jgi:ABC-type bacteriocin/lantibiotic exporter with double-glycine peptidase domain